MKATLEFELPEEEVEFDLAVNAGNYHSAMFDIAFNLRKRVEWFQDSHPEEDVVEYIFNEIGTQIEDLKL